MVETRKKDWTQTHLHRLVTQQPCLSQFDRSHFQCAATGTSRVAFLVFILMANLQNGGNKEVSLAKGSSTPLNNLQFSVLEIKQCMVG